MTRSHTRPFVASLAALALGAIVAAPALAQTTQPGGTRQSKIRLNRTSDAFSEGGGTRSENLGTVTLLAPNATFADASLPSPAFYFVLDGPLPKAPVQVTLTGPDDIVLPTFTVRLDPLPNGLHRVDLAAAVANAKVKLEPDVQYKLSVRVMVSAVDSTFDAQKEPVDHAGVIFREKPSPEGVIDRFYDAVNVLAADPKAGDNAAELKQLLAAEKVDVKLP
jgi:hypothetical protein